MTCFCDLLFKTHGYAHIQTLVSHNPPKQKQMFSSSLFPAACGADPGCRAIRLDRGPPALLLLPQSGLHPSICNVRVSGRRAHPVAPRLALPLLPPHGRHQWILWLRAHDPGGGESASGAERAGR